MTPGVPLAGKMVVLAWIPNSPAIKVTVVINVHKVTVASIVQGKGVACKWTFRFHKYIYTVYLVPHVHFTS